jgi:hypothetical protein
MIDTEIVACQESRDMGRRGKRPVLRRSSEIYDTAFRLQEGEYYPEHHLTNIQTLSRRYPEHTGTELERIYKQACRIECEIEERMGGAIFSESGKAGLLEWLDDNFNGFSRDTFLWAIERVECSLRRKIPSKEDFQLPPQSHPDLDGTRAWRNFGGKTLEKAYAKFRRNPLVYQEDLMWMAPKPFCYYLPVALRHLESDESAEDSDIVECLAANINFHFDSGHDIRAARGCIAVICDYVLANYAKFDVAETVYGDLRPKYQSLKQRIAQDDGGVEAIGGRQAP